MKFNRNNQVKYRRLLDNDKSIGIPAGIEYGVSRRYADPDSFILMDGGNEPIIVTDLSPRMWRRFDDAVESQEMKERQRCLTKKKSTSS